MAETAIERTKRALDLIPYVMERPGITIQELARDFSVSEKQIRADLDLLYVCGLPGYSPLELIDIATDDDYVDIIDPQLLDQPRNLTRREVIALTVALEALAASRNPDDKLQPIIKGLMGKLQSLLEANEGYTHERVGAIVGMSKDTVTRILGILKLPEHMLTEYHDVSEVVSLTTLVDLSRKVGVVEDVVLEDMWQRAKKGKLPRSDIRKPTEQASPVERNLRTLTTTVTALTQAKEKGIMLAADISRLKALRDMINGLLE